MLNNRVKAMQSFFYEQSEIYRIIIMYRFSSLLITSLFYYMSEPAYSMERRLIIIVCIVGSAIILNYLYIRNRGQTKKILLLILVETCGNSLLLIPSGGINSPYVWYSLNTILIASVELSGGYCWLNLAVYLASSASLTILIPTDNNNNILQLMDIERNLVLSLFLITSIIQLLAKYANGMRNTSMRLIDANSQLIQANMKITEALNHTTELYQAVNLFSAQRSRNEIVKLIMHYIQKITKSEAVFFFNLCEDKNRVLVQSEKDSKELIRSLVEENSSLWNKIVESKIPLKACISNKCFNLILIYSNYMNYGILGIETSLDERDTDRNINSDLLFFLSRLSAIAIERFDLEQVNERLLITEEQNRIANEIHDNVLQRLFSISCGIYNLKRKSNNCSVAEEQELEAIRDAINSSMGELRSAIYGLSWKKNGSDNFVMDVMKYINQIRIMNNIEVDFNIKGNSELLSSVQKRAIYRIICEGIGNAVRHGKAENIDIKLDIGMKDTLLKIADNGKGFDTAKEESADQKGLGIRNIELLTSSLNGSFNILSMIGKGTSINISIPNLNMNIRGEKII